MKSKSIIMLLCFFLLSFTENDSDNDAYKYHCVYVPDEKLMNVEIDGFLDDWDWLPEKYIIRSNRLMYKKGVSIDIEDLDGYFFAGWNKITNWIYIVAEIYDNNLDTSNNTYLDKFEVQVNSSNSNQKLISNIMNFEFCKKTDGKDFVVNILDSKSNWMIDGDEFGKYAINIDIDTIQNRNKITYEIGFQLWDEWSPLGAEYSISHILKDNQVVGLVLGAIDNDFEEESSLMYTIGGSGGRYKGYTYYMSNFILDPLTYTTNKVDNMINLINDNFMNLIND